MIFTQTRLPGVFLIDLEPHRDQRGFFARAWCEREFAAHGIKMRCVQCNISYNEKKGTLRGMHYQRVPYAEGKLVRCTHGAIYDVVIDLRRESPTFQAWEAVTLSADTRRMIYIPEGCAHGFQTLEDHTEVFYQMSEFYMPEYASGVRWDDPAFRVAWPEAERIISERDRQYPNFQP